MYIRNIIGAIEELKDDEVLCVNYKSGKSNRIFKKDTVEKVNGEMITSVTVDGRVCKEVNYRIRYGEWKDNDHGGKDNISIIIIEP